MVDYGIGYTIFKYEKGTKTPVQMFRGKPGNIHEAMAELRKRLDKIGNNRMFVNAAMWTMTYGFIVRLLIEV